MYFLVIGISLFLFSFSVLAEDGQTSTEGMRLKEVVVSSTALTEKENLSTPSLVIESESLKLRGGNNIGETLSGQPGIASSYFGPGTGRPVVRGLGGDRVKILENGTGTQDVSSNSPDHPVTVDPANIKKIEILRGPEALLYGTTAIGGVVNIFDNRIPDELPKGPISGKMETQGGTVDNERMGAISLDAPIGQFAMHLDATQRRTDDIDIPGFARTEKLRNSGAELEYPEPKGKLPFSDSDTGNFTVGGSYIAEQGFFGASIGQYNTNYGVPNGEKDTSIDAERQRIDVKGRLYNPIDGIKSADLKIGIVDYEHTEFESAVPGTRFTNRGLDSRLEFKHEKIGNLEGVFGFQFQSADFAAVGEEVVQPPTTTNGEGIFILEEYKLNSKFSFLFGGRADFQRVHVNRFMPFNSLDQFEVTKNFGTFSESIGINYAPQIDESWKLSLAHTQRAPNGQELFANGPHLATATFEVGNQDIGVEDSVGVDLTYKKIGEKFSFTSSAYYNHFFNYIGQFSTGKEKDNLPIFNYRAVGANFLGFESQATYYLEGSSTEIGRVFSLDFQPDYVWAENLDSNDPLPRMAPFRIRTGLNYKEEALFSSRLELQHVFNQSRVADFETTTEGYTFLNAFLNKPLQFDNVACELWVRGTNLLNQKARDHVSFIKDVAPLPGANIAAGIRFRF